MPELVHHRTQLPVGEGLSHAAWLEADDEQLHYVYDCGSQRSYAPARTAAIAELHDRLGGRDIDLLYLSHAHDDHVNGVPALLDGVRARTIVLPFLNDLDRLVSLARAALHGPIDDFYVDWVVDPVRAALGFAPDRVIQVGGTGPGAPGPFGRSPDETPDPLNWSEDSEPAMDIGPGPTTDDVGSVSPVPDEWVFVGRGLVTGRWEGDTVVLQIPDTVGIRPRTSTGLLPWLLATHISPSVDVMRTRFLTRLAAELARPLATLESDLADATELRRIVVERLDAVKAAYGSVRADLNLTSMSLYSGPLPSDDPIVGHSAQRRDGPSCWRSGPARAGWLGTGDARLSARRHRQALVEHFASVADHVNTVTLAHHGALNGFSAELLDAFRAGYWVAPAAPYSTWEHPHPTVVREVELRGRQVIHVDGDPRAIFHEYVALFR